MSAPRLDLDFRRRRHVTLPGLAILATGVAVLLAVGHLHRQTVAEIALRQEQLIHRHRPTPPAADATPLPNTKPQAMQAILHRLTLPWDELFTAIEKASSKDITLLAVLPEASKGTVQLRGEARNLYAVLHYLQTLDDGRYFEKVDLAEHEIAGQNPELPVRFTITAQWSAAERQR